MTEHNTTLRLFWQIREHKCGLKGWYIRVVTENYTLHPKDPDPTLVPFNYCVNVDETCENYTRNMNVTLFVFISEDTLENAPYILCKIKSHEMLIDESKVDLKINNTPHIPTNTTPTPFTTYILPNCVTCSAVCIRPYLLLLCIILTMLYIAL